MSQEKKAQAFRDPVIPDKLYFRIGEVARLLAVETHTLRFWETEFPQLRVGKGGTGQRLYRRRDVELVLEIRHLLYEEGYTIPGARQFLGSRHHPKPPRNPDAEKSAPAPKSKQDSAAEPDRSSAAPPPGREANLHRLRAELRDLSTMLGSENTKNLNDSAKNPERKSAGDNRQQSARSRSHHGLHLAGRPERRLSESSQHRLFEPDTD